ncbi:MAG: nucleotidyltransferase domain-containing protein [Candidatus Woesearchaeota archaeon]
MDYHNLINKNVIKIIESLKKDRLYFNQIHEATGIKSKNSLVKELNKLTQSKILIREKNKSNTFYSINLKNRFSLALLEVINSGRFQTLPFERREAINEVIEITKPMLAILFGSTAKGSYGKESDMDLLLIYNGDYKRVYNPERVDEISARYGLKIKPIIMRASELKMHDSTIKHIFETGYPLTGHIYFYGFMESFYNV